MRKQISEIVVNNRMRRSTPEKVEKLAQSIKNVGLIQPICINSDNVLVAGLHRLEACKTLGYTEIECNLVDFNSTDAQSLAEIDENFVRNELTALERAELYVERDKLYYKIQTEGKHGKAPDESKHQGATIFGDTLIGTRLSQPIKERIYGTELENQKTNLYNLSFLTEEKQAEVLDHKIKHPEKNYKDIIESVRSEKREYKDVIISCKVTRSDYNTLKQQAEKNGQTIYEFEGNLHAVMAKYIRNNPVDMIPIELEEMFDGFGMLSRDDYQTTKKGVSI